MVRNLRTGGILVAACLMSHHPREEGYPGPLFPNSQPSNRRWLRVAPSPSGLNESPADNTR